MALITLQSYTNPWDAHIAQGLLEAEGIPCYITDEYHIGINWFYSNALGGTKLQVNSSDALHAMEILNDMQAGEYAQALQQQVGAAEGEHCPRCGSTDFHSRYTVLTIVMLVFTLGLGMVFAPRRSVHSCRQCGYHWTN